MAALNTLRTKGSILLTAVIGISLLAFLLGDGTSLFNNNTVSVGTVDGQSINLNNYSTEVELLTNIRQYMSNTTSLSAEESEAVQGQVWNKMVSDIILIPSYSDLGLNVSDDELLDMVNGTYLSPIVMQIFTDPETGRFNKERLTQYVQNLDMDPSGRSRQFWSYIEEQVEDTRMNQKYNSLVSKGMYVTNLQVEQAVAANENEYNIEYVTKSLGTIADDAVKVTDADLLEYYKKHSKRFMYQDASEVEYITFDVVPSANDYKDAEKDVLNLTNEFRADDNVEQYVNFNSENKFDARYLKAENLPAYLRNSLSSATIGSTFDPYFENNVYTICKISDIKNIPDSIELRSVYVDPSKNIDSVLNVIKKSKGGFDAVVATLALSNVEESSAIKVSTSDLAPTFTDKLFKAKKGDVVTFDAQGVKQIIKVISLDAPVKKYQVGQVVITVVPSSRTEQAIYANATSFINEITEGKTFAEAVESNQYIKRSTTVLPSQREFAGMESSNELVRWSFTAKEGALSHIVSAENINVVAYLKKSLVKGDAPFEEIKEEIRPMCIAKMKMDMAIKELSGVTSLESIASKVGTSVGTASDVKFSMMTIPGIGIAPEVIGAISSLKEGVISSGIPAGNSAAVVKVVSKSSDTGIDAPKMRVLLETNATSYLDMRISAIIAEMSNIKDNRVIYY